MGGPFGRANATTSKKKSTLISAEELKATRLPLPLRFAIPLSSFQQAAESDRMATCAPKTRASPSHQLVADYDVGLPRIALVSVKSGKRSTWPCYLVTP